MKTKTRKKAVAKMVRPELAEPWGKSSFLQLTWKDWKKETPPNGKQIFVIIKYKMGYYPMLGTYIEETLEKTKGVLGGTWRYVMIHDFALSKIFLEDKVPNSLIAWAELKALTPLLKSECPLCQEANCVC